MMAERSLAPVALFTVFDRSLFEDDFSRRFPVVALREGEATPLTNGPGTDSTLECVGRSSQ